MAPMLDGMGEDSWNERQNMRASRQEQPKAPFTIIALDSNGNELYETEDAWTEEASIEELEACNNLLSFDPERFPNVDTFAIKDRR